MTNTLINKLNEARLKFNGKAKEYLGNWTTRDVQLEDMLPIIGIGVGALGGFTFAKSTGMIIPHYSDNQGASILMGIYGGIAGGIIGDLSCMFYSKFKEKDVQEINSGEPLI